jgi:hypothetical protein
MKMASPPGCYTIGRAGHTKQGQVWYEKKKGLGTKIQDMGGIRGESKNWELGWEAMHVNAVALGDERCRQELFRRS